MAEHPGDSPTGGDDRTSGASAGTAGAETTGTTTAGPLPFSQVVGRVVLVLVALLFVIFAVVNRQPVDFDWVFGESQVVRQGGEYVGGGVPLIVLLIGSFILGGLVTAGWMWRQRQVRRSRRTGQDGDDGA